MKSASSSFANDFQFTGEQWDADAGLYYLRARYYDPSTGRFTSRDPWAGNMGNPQSLNRYVYTYNNPANLTDPSGKVVPFLIIAGVALAPEEVALIGAAAIAVTGAVSIYVQQHQEEIQRSVNSVGASCLTAIDRFSQAHSKEFPRNPDEWVPPSGVREEPKARDNTGGGIRHWVDETGRLVRQWHRGIPGEPGWKGKDHWHDETIDDPDNHVLPED